MYHSTIMRSSNIVYKLPPHLLKIRVVGIEKIETKKLYLNAHIKELESMMMRTIEYKKAMALKEEEDKKMKAMKSNDNDNNAAVDEKKIKNKGIQKRILTFILKAPKTMIPNLCKYKGHCQDNYKRKASTKTNTSANANANGDENSDKNKEEMRFEFFTFPLFGRSVFTLNSVIIHYSFFSLLIFFCHFYKGQETLAILLSTRFF
ncbi:hypothetical protein RFI_37255 [Reticulomyxa filosa]|uniref:Uncharacterized protein n=1 Tax=Reticulomyxa filosa TaxID=46433 RepID=X6LGC8_RETFI|nr:hypothetical protein RFI_37255 [Reticulomyxa filosa]|eukprot:ETO00192.1 hypothetical protein RFI_37255 [Reticulomyxa filosa]